MPRLPYRALPDHTKPCHTKPATPCLAPLDPDTPRLACLAKPNSAVPYPDMPYHACRAKPHLACLTSPRLASTNPVLPCQTMPATSCLTSPSRALPHLACLATPRHDAPHPASPRLPRHAYLTYAPHTLSMASHIGFNFATEAYSLRKLIKRSLMLFSLRSVASGQFLASAACT